MNKSDQLTRLGNIFQITSGGTPSRKNLAFFDNGAIPWFKTGDLKQRDLFESEEKITQEALNSSSAKLFPPDTVLVAMYGATIGACGILRVNGATNQACAAFLPNEKVLPEFLYYFISFNKRNFVKIGVGGAQPNISAEKLKNFRIVLPSVQDQQKIVQTINRAESLLQKRRRTLRLADDFLKSAFLEMFGDPINNPKKWKLIKGENLFTFSSGKFNPTKNLDDTYPYPTYGGNGITGYSQEYLVDFDTLVIGRVGVYCGCIHRTRGKVWITDNAIYIKAFKEPVNLEYLCYLFEFFHLNNFANKSGQPKITQQPLENLNVPLAPFDVQQKFADLVRKVEKLKEKQKQSEAQLQNLFSSLMQRAFRGDLIS